MADDPRTAALNAHGKALDEEIRLLESFRVAAPANRWQHAVLSLAARAIQLQRAVHDAAVLGYADDELAALGRAMLSTLVTLAYIGRARNGREREARVLAWTLHHFRSEERLREYLWRSHRASKADMDADTSASRKAYDAMVDEAAVRGIRPAPKLGKRETWTGLSDFELFRRARYLRFYREYYGPWSDETHAGPTALNAFLQQGVRGAYEIGPQRRNPWFLLFATARFGALVLGHLNATYRLRQDAAIRKMFDTMQDDFSKVVELTRTVGEPGEPESRA